MSPRVCLSTGGGAASLAVIVASLALGKSALKVSRLHLHGTDAVETGAYLTRFPGFRTHVKRELPIFWRAGQGSMQGSLRALCIPIFLGKI